MRSNSAIWQRMEQLYGVFIPRQWKLCSFILKYLVFDVRMDKMILKRFLLNTRFMLNAANKLLPMKLNAHGLYEPHIKMPLKDRIKEYREVNKGPLRTLLKIKIGDSIVFSHQNGVCACEGSVDTQSIGKIIEKGEFTIVQLKREYMPNSVVKSEEIFE